MSLPLLAVAYLPSIEYMAMLLKHGGAVIDIHETYPKQTYRNRCHIASSGGLLALVVPVLKPNGNHTKTGEIEISYHLPWNRTHWRSIEAAYNSSPFFLYYRDAFESLYNSRFVSLVEMNTAFLNSILSLMKINIPIKFSDSYYFSTPGEVDLRIAVHPKKKPVYCTLSGFPEYTQVFGEENGFIPNLSIIDLLFNLGPDAKDYLEKLSNTFSK